MEAMLIEMAKFVFTSAVAWFKSKGDDDATAKEKAAAMLQDAPRRVDLETEELERIAGQ